MIKINLTEDIIKVLPLIKITKSEEIIGCEINSRDMFWGGTVVENFMQAWGKFDKHVTINEEKIWDEELEKKAWETYDYIIDNMDDIISIIFYTLPNIKEGVYSRRKKEPGIWNFQPFD